MKVLPKVDDLSNVVRQRFLHSILSSSFRSGLDCNAVCSFYGFSELEDCIVLVHGPRTCAYHLNLLPVDAIRLKILKKHYNPPTFFTGVGEEATIYGGTDKLRDSLEQLARKYAKKFVLGVVTTCIPSIIGDDVEFAIREVQESFDVKVVSVRSPGFEDERGKIDDFVEATRESIRGEEAKAGIEGCGRINAWKAIIEQLVLERDVEVEVDERAVNLETYGRLHYFEDLEGEIEEFKNLLGLMGLKLNVVFPGCSSSDVLKIPRAPLSVIRRSRRVFEELQKKFDLRYLYDPLHTNYVGIEGVERLYLDIGRFYGREGEAENVLKLVRSEFDDYIDKFKETLRGRRVAISLTPSTVTMAFLKFIELLGLKIEIVFISTEWLDRYGADKDKTLKLANELASTITSDLESSPDVYINLDVYSEAAKAKKRSIDIALIANLSDTLQRSFIYDSQGVLSLPIQESGFSMFRYSFSSMLRLPNAMVKLLNNPQLERKPLYSRFTFHPYLYPVTLDETPFRLCYEAIMREIWKGG